MVGWTRTVVDVDYKRFVFSSGVLRRFVMSVILVIIGIFALRNFRDFLPKKELISVYHALIGSHLNYGIIAWGITNNKNMEKLLRLQKWAIRTSQAYTPIMLVRLSMIRV